MLLLDRFLFLFVMEGPCQVCGKPSGPCKIRGKDKSFFCISLIKCFEEHVTIPCYVREQFNKLTSNMSLLTFLIAILITSWEMLSTQMVYLCVMGKRKTCAAILRYVVLEQEHSLCIGYLILI